MKNLIASAVSFLVVFFRKTNEKTSVPVMVIASISCISIFVLFVYFVVFVVNTVRLYASYMRME